jgi:hypothetical protein
MGCNLTVNSRECTPMEMVFTEESEGQQRQKQQKLKSPSFSFVSFCEITRYKETDETGNGV